MKFSSNKAPSLVVTGTQGRYVGISHAGSGKSCDVFYAIPQVVFKEERTVGTRRTLPSQVCVVKVFKSLYSNYFKKELPALKRLEYVPQQLKARFTEPLEFTDGDENDQSRAPWYSMKAVHGFQLTRLFTAVGAIKSPVPAELVFHGYVQLNEAIQFLHNTKPPMIHGDLCDPNIMVDLAQQEISGFPNFKLIDFGDSLAGKDLHEYISLHEKIRLYQLIQEIAWLNHSCKNATALFPTRGLAPCIHDAEFTDFVDTLDSRIEAGVYGNGSHEHLDTDLQHRLPNILSAKVKSASGATLQAIDLLMKEAIKISASKFPTDQQILSACAPSPKYDICDGLDVMDSQTSTITNGICREENRCAT